MSPVWAVKRKVRIGLLDAAELMVLIRGVSWLNFAHETVRILANQRRRMEDKNVAGVQSQGIITLDSGHSLSPSKIYLLKICLFRDQKILSHLSVLQTKF